MTSQNESAAPPEIVIVRRRSNDDDDGHHGSAWKIAYADFVTAMMAFFLVMWLINSSDEQTVSQVAAYFNPIKLNSKNPSKKGVQEAESNPGVNMQGSAPGTKDGKISDKKSNSGKQPDVDQENSDLTESEQKMFSDPFGTLDQIAQLQDPVVLPRPDERKNKIVAEISKPFVNPSVGDGETILESINKLPEDLNKPPADPIVSNSDEVEKTVPPETSEEREKQQYDKVKKLEEKIQSMLVALDPAEKPLLQFEKVKEGILITLTDQFDFSMFRNGSAKPKPQLITAIDAIAKILQETPGDVVILGHTDATPYVSKVYDNWRLSTARAQMARYMLKRAGLEEKRVARIEGYGSTLPRIKAYPRAAENRRIEILLRN